MGYNVLKGEKSSTEISSTVRYVLWRILWGEGGDRSRNEFGRYLEDLLGGRGDRVEMIFVAT